MKLDLSPLPCPSHLKSLPFFDPPGRPQSLVITIFARVVRPSIRPYIHMSVPAFQSLAKRNKVLVGIVIATGGTVGLAEWIIPNLLYFLAFFTLFQFSLLPWKIGFFVFATKKWPHWYESKDRSISKHFKKLLNKACIFIF